eukprot:m.25446 g.25446  ORF g.25446 m.25446 type:complete len:254 (+) comp11600_c0_seq2:39-800(+)
MAESLHTALSQYHKQEQSREATFDSLQELTATGNNNEAACKSRAHWHIAMLAAMADQHEALGLAQRAVEHMIDTKRRQSDPFYAPAASSFSAMINALDTSLQPWYSNESVPSLCGGTPLPETSSIPVGHEVAAFDGSIWILGIVVKFEGRDKYVIEDFIHDAESERTTRNMTRKTLVPLPFWQPLWDCTVAFYPIGSAVLALYPQTTCFYPAEVSQLPTEAKPTYTLHFDDDDYEDGRVRFQEVAVKYVIPAQ